MKNNEKEETFNFLLKKSLKGSAILLLVTFVVIPTLAYLLTSKP